MFSFPVHAFSQLIYSYLALFSARVALSELKIHIFLMCPCTVCVNFIPWESRDMLRLRSCQSDSCLHFQHGPVHLEEKSLSIGQMYRIIPQLFKMFSDWTITVNETLRLYFSEWRKSCMCGLSPHAFELDPMLVIVKMSAGWRICDREGCTAVFKVTSIMVNQSRSFHLISFSSNYFLIKCVKFPFPIPRINVHNIKLHCVLCVFKCY